MNFQALLYSTTKKTSALLTTLITVLLFCITQPGYSALSHDQALIWKSLQSEHFDIHFHDQENELAQKTLQTAEKVLTMLQDTLQWTPKTSIDIVLSDERDVAENFSTLFPPKLRISLYLTIPNQFTDFDDWLLRIITQKLTNLVYTDKASETAQTFRGIFGRHPLLFANYYQPNWLKAGLAIYLESDTINGTGEGQSSLFAMMMRMEVSKGLKTLQQINTNHAIWPATQTHALYGYFFYRFLEEKYGRPAVLEFINNFETSLIPFKVSQVTSLKLNKTIDELWDEFTLHIQETFDVQTSSIIDSEVVVGAQLTTNGYYKILAKPLDEMNLLIAQYSGTYRPEVLVRNTESGTSFNVAQIEQDAQVDSHPTAGIVISQVEAYRNTNHYKDLYHVDIHSKTFKRLTRGDRYVRTTWHPDGEQMIAIHSKLGKHTLVLLNQDGRLIDLLWEGKYGEYISDINWSPDGLKIIASVKRVNTSWQIEEFDINKRRWKKFTFTSDIETQPQYSRDGKSVFFTADYMGIFNIRRLDLDTKNVTTLTNVIGGAFAPQPGFKNDLYYIGYTQNGYDVFYLENVEDLPVDTITKSIVKEENTINDDVSNRFEIDDYSAFKYLIPDWWSPTLQIDSKSTKLGIYTAASDPLNRHSYDALLSFDTESSKTSGSMNYRYDRWFPLIQFYLNSNNRKNLRHEVYQAEVLAPLVSVRGKWFVGLSYSVDEIYEEDPTNSDSMILTNNPSFGFGAIYDSRKYNLLANSISDGRLMSLVIETSNVANSDYEGQAIVGKWQEYLTIIPEHVVSFQMIGGFGLNKPRNFQLGGHHENDIMLRNMVSNIPQKPTLYNKRSYYFRGYRADSSDLLGRRMVLYNLEWRFPIKRVAKSVNNASFIGIEQLAGTVFTEIGSTWDEGIWPERHKQSVGAELRLFTELFYFLPTQINLGYAYGFDSDREDQIYLTLSSTF